MKRQTDEDVYISQYVEFYREVAPADATIDTTPKVQPDIESVLPAFGPSQLFLFRHLLLPKEYREALEDLTGLTFTAKVIIYSKEYYGYTRKLKALTLAAALPKRIGVKVTISRPERLFRRARILREEADATEVAEVKSLVDEIMKIDIEELLK